MKKNIGILILAINLCFATLYGQTDLKGKVGVSKTLAIKGAKAADRSYKFIKFSYKTDDPDLSAKSLDSAAVFLDIASVYMDSSIICASDSELIAVNLANLSLQFAKQTSEMVAAMKQQNFTLRGSSGMETSIMCANVVSDAYHASMYFRGELKKKEQAPPTKKDSLPKIITKLDVDQTVFTMLIKDLEAKITANQTQINKLNTELAKTKEAAKTKKVKGQIQKLETENLTYNQKISDSKLKLTEINKQIEQRDKSGITSSKTENEPTKGLHFESLDEWNKHLILDQDLPPTLLYQVQVGVYKNKVLYEIFKGLTPVYGKTTPSGVSYSIGMFEKFDDANQAKDYVKSIGLADAFVVAYNNKKRVDLNQAKKLEKK